MENVALVPAQERDWQMFLALAADEGWRVPSNEIAYHRRCRRTLALALRRDENTIGFVTASRHEKSGWIGNLLIAPAERGRGYGGQLFERAVQALRNRGVSAVWLTASERGAPLYARRGFVAVGDVVRWLRPQGGEGRRIFSATASRSGRDADAEAWGDDRTLLLRYLERQGCWVRAGETIALLQQTAQQQIVGPWLALTPGAGQQPVLEELVRIACPGRELVLDALAAANAPALQAAGFQPVGRTCWMVLGTAAALRPRQLLSLASLGSAG